MTNSLGYQLSPDQSIYQPLIDRAEEDLLCAIALYRRRFCGCAGNNICFFLHQSVEKWLKLLIGVTAQKLPGGIKSHELYERFRLLAQLENLHYLDEVKSEIEEVDGKILGHRFPGELRYNETPSDIESYIQVLLKAAFKTRRIAKKYLGRSDNPCHEEA